ncbi:bifunctional adenosylcobinamide kinase/adenosylcobinamide-phosphate guanylyltransferase [Methylovirgula ligni]|uniref:Bifunctional adenosylcobalamin biosynthesis protein n=1 Tax=Methylovirgula ligni TaxID=569860 RepID=A0A3D9Z295_9HYPH|nr:bifunctional adenosylcobinamide kinase/adenosylcobinamide-phosphate guanylyltransferase [Methylovirgula ligni]QAY95385.1 bifunctional adenosylcobinamide kinase/adenosylcobinamide-phosphate guanylyltransferase [Methylovirgula ligni]REF89294.1 adenosylcobinamide kinase /adenosylcobinamide-phosphate guanylyltransferase [Methylovirgula ligni]
MAEAQGIRSLLVIGGARSGKSRYAQMAAERSGKKPVLIATGEAKDAEMAARIAAHQAERGSHWCTIEAPLALGDALKAAAAPSTIVLVDCLTLWLSNLMLAGGDAAAEGQHLADVIATLAGPVIFVSNEVGSGIVPDNILARRFQDAQGRLNQTIAAACDSVVLVAAGLPLTLKPSAHSASIL